MNLFSRKAPKQPVKPTKNTIQPNIMHIAAGSYFKWVIFDIFRKFSFSWYAHIPIPATKPPKSLNKQCFYPKVIIHWTSISLSVHLKHTQQAKLNVNIIYFMQKLTSEGGIIFSCFLAIIATQLHQ